MSNKSGKGCSYVLFDDRYHSDPEEAEVLMAFDARYDGQAIKESAETFPGFSMVLVKCDVVSADDPVKYPDGQLVNDRVIKTWRPNE